MKRKTKTGLKLITSLIDRLPKDKNEHSTSFQNDDDEE